MLFVPAIVRTSPNNDQDLFKGLGWLHKYTKGMLQHPSLIKVPINDGS